MDNTKSSLLNKNTEVKIYSVNVCSLLADNDTRYQELAARVVEIQPHAVLVQETWLVSSKLNSRVAIPGYTIYRHDRDDRPGGGVAIYVRSDLSVVGGPFRTNNGYGYNSSIEAITVYVQINGKIFSLTSTYRSPTRNIAPIMPYTCRLIWHFLLHPAEYSVVGGDLNCCLDFDNAKTRPDEIVPSLALYFLGLQPTVYKATHGERIIDQIFIPKSAELIESELDDPIEKEHCPVFIRFQVTDEGSRDSDNDWENFEKFIDPHHYRKIKETIEKVIQECTMEHVFLYIRSICEMRLQYALCEAQKLMQECKEDNVRDYMQLVRHKINQNVQREAGKAIKPCKTETIFKYMTCIHDMINQCGNFQQSAFNIVLKAIPEHIGVKRPETGAVTAPIVGETIGGIVGELVTGPAQAVIGGGSGALIGRAIERELGDKAQEVGCGDSGEAGEAEGDVESAIVDGMASLRISAEAVPVPATVAVVATEASLATDPAKFIADQICTLLLESSDHAISLMIQTEAAHVITTAL